MSFDLSVDTRIEIHKEIDENLVWSDGFVMNEDELQGTILDKDLSKYGGYIICNLDIVTNGGAVYKKGDKIPVPSIVGVYTKAYEEGLTYLTNLQRYFNSVVRGMDEIKNRHLTPMFENWILMLFVGIKKELSMRLSGKYGIVDNHINTIPFPYSARATIIPAYNIEPNQIKIPRKVAKSWIKQELFRIEFNIPLELSTNEALEYIKGMRLIVGRQPTHSPANVQAMKLKGYTDYVISVHPSIIGMFDGDFDGDTMYCIATKNIPYNMYIENMIPDYYVDTKEYEVFSDKKVNCYEDLKNKITEVEKIILNGTTIDPLKSNSYPKYEVNIYTSGVTEDTLLENDGAAVFKIMKRDVSIAGGISNTLVSLASVLNKNKKEELYEHITFFRHMLSQAPLDCKHGLDDYFGTTMLFAINSILYSGAKKSNHMLSLLEKIYDNKEILDSVVKMMKIYDYEKVNDIIKLKNPVYLYRKNNYFNHRAVNKYIMKEQKRVL